VGCMRESWWKGRDGRIQDLCAVAVELAAASDRRAVPTRAAFPEAHRVHSNSLWLKPFYSKLRNRLRPTKDPVKSSWNTGITVV
jgi:hypothetical protein